MPAHRRAARARDHRRSNDLLVAGTTASFSCEKMNKPDLDTFSMPSDNPRSVGSGLSKAHRVFAFVFRERARQDIAPDERIDRDLRVFA